jgi:hypothetical protein
MSYVMVDAEQTLKILQKIRSKLEQQLDQQIDRCAERKIESGEKLIRKVNNWSALHRFFRMGFFRKMTTKDLLYSCGDCTSTGYLCSSCFGSHHASAHKRHRLDKVRSLIGFVKASIEMGNSKVILSEDDWH